MTEYSRTRVEDVRGNVHTGDGDQHNNQHVHLYGLSAVRAYVRDAKGRSPRLVADDELVRLRRQFVYPALFADARAVLERESMVLVAGEPGSGRSSAARMLLHEVRAGAGRFYELMTGTDEDERPMNLDATAVGERDRLLLDLSDADQDEWHRVASQLAAYRQVVRECSARLVVVPPATGVAPVRPELRRYQVLIGAPPADRVLIKHLRLSGIPVDGPDSLPGKLTRLLSRHSSPGEIAELADLVFRAKGAEPRKVFGDWCDVAFKAFTARDVDLEKRMSSLQEGPPRALLLTVAMLHGAHGDVIHRGTGALLAAVGYPRDDTPFLDGADLAQRLKQVRAGTTADGRVHFDALGYDTAVRERFWRYFPEVRRPLGAWLGEMLDAPELTLDDRDALVRRFAAQCLSTGSLHRFEDRVTEWTSGTNPRRLRAAAQALEHGLHDLRYGGFFRRRIYEWSKARPSPGLTAVLVGVCAEVMAVRRPDQAVVRLHQLARRQRDGRSAHEALVQLAEQTPRLRRMLLARLGAPPGDRAWSADAALFLDLATPAALTGGEHPPIGEPVVRGHLAGGWAAAFAACPPQEWGAYATRWLAAAGDDEHAGDLLLDVLVDGCGTRADHLGRLYTVARAWSRADASERSRADVAARLRRRIDVVQGYSATMPPRRPPRTRETTP
ncbi:hypothetical protein ACWERV_23935 [Streptomyces sp. NPDC004031]